MLINNAEKSWVSTLFKNTPRHIEKTLSPGQQKALEITGNSGADGDNDTYLNEIKTKLQNGYELSTSELEYLRENAPDLYKEAMRMIALAKEIEAKLKECKSKEEYARAQSEINNRIASECDVSPSKKVDLEHSLMYQRRINTANRCYVKFCKTDSFRNLPDTDAEYVRLKAERRKEKFSDKVELSRKRTGEGEAEKNLEGEDASEVEADKNQLEKNSDKKKLETAEKKEKTQTKKKTFEEVMPKPQPQPRELNIVI